MTKQKKSKLIIFLTVFIYLVGFGVVIPMTPILARDFGATPVQVGLLMAVYSVMQFLFSPFWGRMSDKVGRRPILLFCLLGEALACVLFAASRNLQVLFAARALAGFFGASISTASAYISDITPTNERSKGMALIGAAFGLGFIVGPALGGVLTMWGESISKEPHFGTSFALLWVAGLCVANFAFGVKFLKESLTHVGQVKPRDLGRFKQIFNYFSKPLIGPLMIVFFLNSFGFSMMESNLVLLMGDRFQWGLREVSFGFVYIGVMTAFNQGYLVRKLLPLFGEKKLMIMGLTFMALAFSGIALSTEIWMMAISMTVLSFGTAFVNPSVLGSVSLLSSSNEQGAVLGTTQGLAALGRILGPALGGFIYQHLHLTAPFFTASILILIGFILVGRVYSQLPETGKTLNSV